MEAEMRHLYNEEGYTIYEIIDEFDVTRGQAQYYLIDKPRR